MSVNLEHPSMPGPPSKSEITWTGPMPFFLDSTISSEFLTMPLFDGMQEWSMSGSTPGAAAAAASGGFDGFQQQQQQQQQSQKQAQPSPPAHQHHHHPQQSYMNAFIEPTLFSPDQPMPTHVHHPQPPHLAPKEPLIDPAMQPFAASPTSSYHVPMHEITSRGSISDQSQRSSYGSISSISSSSSSSSTTGYYAQRRPSEPVFSPAHDAVEQQKRERFLERNRVAANKCRRKKKEHTRQLESRCMEVTQANSRLDSEVSQLRSQILELKNELLRHSGCDDPAIKAHLARMVAHLSQRSASVSGASESEGGGPQVRSSRSTPLSPAQPKILKEEVEQDAAFGFDDMLHLPNAGGSKTDELEEEKEEEELKMKESP
ncbi:uncharacterized protein BO72DRAFT_155523 [Aspergillus fijiensis CBS 313.89]|uniref:BZIP domain-containing protein n=1 Tax=Aspergillus fijiensis CBS 313.89 TaxID=1448319 RepID=A0A8G1RPD9_9EURO|nr:uncharacterized protein BO72DRAFT_155523 [Aspergillus fijiensis CBS 313.89]RAK75878.1 hypothetical protein BO72DRAFT_155523 [Aspergillus fijiensis CBS 313.89]